MSTTVDEPRTLPLLQIAGGAAAAASAAALASWLGVAGTVVGAAIGSAVATIAGSAYTRSLHRAHRVATRSPLRLAVSALVVLGVALSGITGVEAVAGRPLATLLGRSTDTGSTVSALVTGHRSTPVRRAARTTQPATSTSSPATPTPTPTTTPSAQPTTQPTTAPTAAPTTQPTPQPTADPTSGLPTAG